MTEHLVLWTTSLIVLMVGIFAAINGLRFYQYKKAGTTAGPTGPEVYWAAPEYFDAAENGYVLAGSTFSNDSPTPTVGSGYANFNAAIGSAGIMATYLDLKEAFDNGMTVNRWGFFDGQCGTDPPGPTGSPGSPGYVSAINPRGRFCAINCCGLSATGSSPPPCPVQTSEIVGSDNPCTTPSASVPITGGASPNYCCSGTAPSPITGLCSPCFSEDTGLTTSCTAWYPEADGLFVACPQANSGAGNIPDIPGGPWDSTGGGGPAQPSASPSSMNLYQLNNGTATYRFNSSPTPEEFAQINMTTGGFGGYRYAYDANNNEPLSPGASGSPSNPQAGVFVVGVKPPQDSSAATNILPFDVTGTTPGSNNGWNDPNAVANAPPAPPFQWVPASQVIFFSVIVAALAFVFGIMWFRSTRLGQSILYWL